MDKITYKYYRKNDSKKIYIILHGGGPVGVETDFISSIFNAVSSTKNSVLCFNFPYCERGEESSSGPELKEEIATLKRVVEYVKNQGYNEIYLIAKSLGGIIASYYLKQNPSDKIKMAILGYIPNEIQQDDIAENLALVIQGEKDRFASPAEVSNLVKNSTTVFEIKNADHSYRNEQKEPIYQSAAVERILEWIKG